MGFCCCLVGDLNNDLAKVAKIALSLDIPVDNLSSISDISGVKFTSVPIMFLSKRVTDEEAKKINGYNIITCGAKEDFSNIRSKMHLPAPLNASAIMKVFDRFCTSKDEFIYADPKTKTLLDICKRVALTNASILLTGESGTGKEMVTRFIHNHSNRAKNSFVAINCAAIPENLLESELFGHEKGSFTGAISQHIGKFEEAHNGTLFLDEISEMSSHLQAKLLRAVQEKEVNRLGGNKTIKVNCRIIASSNRDLKAYVDAMKFRADLYYRINVINLEIPPLRDRPKDIIVLAEYFIKRYCAQNNTKEKTLSPTAVESLMEYSWPGNVRELENAIHRCVILEPGDTITGIYGISEG